jgi:hypothetical protein
MQLHVRTAEGWLSQWFVVDVDSVTLLGTVVSMICQKAKWCCGTNDLRLMIMLKDLHVDLVQESLRNPSWTVKTLGINPVLRPLSTILSDLLTSRYIGRTRKDASQDFGRRSES